MEQAVSQSDFVVIICTENYAIKADHRAGGVGYESLVITAEVAREALTDKFIPVLRQGTFEKSLPIYLGSRLGVDLRGDPYNEDHYEEAAPAVARPADHRTTYREKAGFSFGDWRLNSGLPATDNAVEIEPRSPVKPVEQKPNASVWARYDKPGHADAWVSTIIRTWADDRYSLEIVKGNVIEAEMFAPTKKEVIALFNQYNQDLLSSGYKRMQFTPGPDPRFSRHPVSTAIYINVLRMRLRHAKAGLFPNLFP